MCYNIIKERMIHMSNKYYCENKTDFERKCENIRAHGIHVAYADLYDAQNAQYDGYEQIYLVGHKLYRIAEHSNPLAYNGERYVAAPVLGADDVSHDIRDRSEDYFVHGLGLTSECYHALCQIYNVTAK